MEMRPKNPTTKGSSEWFTGDVFVDAIARGHGATPTSIAFVHFSPGARTAWHSHSVAQTLYVTEGEGLVQSRDGMIVGLRAGDVVITPGHEWHWHGASPDHFMTHLAISEGEAEWGEHVTDREYQPGPRDASGSGG